MEELRKLIKLEDNLNEEKHLRVWNGKYKKTKLSIIVKIIKLSGLSERDKSGVGQQCSMLNNLHHPNIVNYLQIIKSKNEICIIMEKLKGDSLHELITKLKRNNIRLSEIKISMIMKGILRALKYFHENNIIHKNITTESLIFSRENDYSSIKLIGFGLSKMEMTQKEESKNGKRISLKSNDIYCAGQIMYNLLRINEYPEKWPPKEELHNIGSKLSMNFLEGILCDNPTERYTAIEALSHPWITRATTSRISNIHRVPNIPIKNKLRSFIKLFLYMGIRRGVDCGYEYKKKLNRVFDIIILKTLTLNNKSRGSIRNKQNIQVTSNQPIPHKLPASKNLIQIENSCDVKQFKTFKLLDEKYMKIGKKNDMKALIKKLIEKSKKGLRAKGSMEGSIRQHEHNSSKSSIRGSERHSPPRTLNKDLIMVSDTPERRHNRHGENESRSIKPGNPPKVCKIIPRVIDKNNVGNNKLGVGMGIVQGEGNNTNRINTMNNMNNMNSIKSINSINRMNRMNYDKEIYGRYRYNKRNPNCSVEAQNYIENPINNPQEIYSNKKHNNKRISSLESSPRDHNMNILPNIQPTNKFLNRKESLASTINYHGMPLPVVKEVQILQREGIYHSNTLSLAQIPDVRNTKLNNGESPGYLTHKHSGIELKSNTNTNTSQAFEEERRSEENSIFHPGNFHIESRISLGSHENPKNPKVKKSPRGVIIERSGGEFGELGELGEFPGTHVHHSRGKLKLHPTLSNIHKNRRLPMCLPPTDNTLVLNNPLNNMNLRKIQQHNHSELGHKKCVQGKLTVEEKLLQFKDIIDDIDVYRNNPHKHPNTRNNNLDCNSKSVDREFTNNNNNNNSGWMGSNTINGYASKARLPDSHSNDSLTKEVINVFIMS